MGAWDHIYQFGLRADPDTPLAYGILAVKTELAYNNTADAKLNPTSLACGRPFERSVKAFQAAFGLTVDGEVGRQTGAALFRKRARGVAKSFGVPNDYVCKLMHLESACDPGAVGVADPNDLGLLQIHMPAHPTITIEQAFNPEFALDFAGHGLSTAFGALANWDSAIASWNVGLGGAQAWQKAGRPASLFEPWFTAPDGTPIDLGARATEYVRLVKGQSC